MPGATATPHVDAPPRPSAFARPRLIAPHYLAIGGVAQIALDDLLPLAIFVGRPWSLLGWLPILVGVGIQLAAFARFRHHRTPVMPGRRAATLVTGGVYRLTRNPMYLGMVLILLGGVIIGGSLGPAIVPPLFVWVVQRRVIAPEERALAAHFGDAYRDYCARVRRWV